MNFDIINSTEEERSAKIDELLAQIDKLEDKSLGIKEQITQLDKEYAHYFTQQETISVKSKKLHISSWCSIFLGIAVAVVSFLFLKEYLTIGLIVGLCLAFFGVILRIGKRRYTAEFNSISQDLAPYYAQKDKYREEINAYNKQIEELESQIVEIANYGKLLIFNELSNRSGHYLMIVTCEKDWTRIGVPKEPTIGKKYGDIQYVTDSLLYADGNVCGIGKKVHGKNQDFMITYAKPAPGVHSFCPQITYKANGNREMYPPYWDAPWVDNMTIYKWYHISINEEHSLVYSQNFTSLEELCKTLNITQAEIVDNI